MSITVPYTFTNTTTADATEVNANFAAILAKALDKTGDTMSGALVVPTLTITGALDLSASGLTLVVGQAINDLFYSGGATTLTRIPAAASSVLITGGTNVPALSQTLPAAVQGNITALGTVISGAFPAANLSGTALPAAVVGSSLTSVGTLGDLTVTNPITGSVTGNAGTLTVADTTSATCLVGLWESATGSLAGKTDAALTYNASTGALSATSLAGTWAGAAISMALGGTGADLSTIAKGGVITGSGSGAVGITTVGTDGYVLTADTASTNGVKWAAGAASPTISVADTTSATCWVALWEAATGTLSGKSDGGLTYNATTGALTTTTFLGALTGNVTGNVSGSSGSCTGNAATSSSCSGNAATATKLAAPAQINLMNFDGSANITITAAAGTLTGTTLNATVVTSSLTSVGTLANLTVTNTITGAISGNAATATALATPRTISRVSFNGTANINLEVVATLTDGATPALNASLGTIFYLSAAGNRTIAVPSNLVDGQTFIIAHYANGGARTLALNTGAGGFAYGDNVPALTETASGKTDLIGCKYLAAIGKCLVCAYDKGFA